MTDVIVIGGGPAGLSAGLFTAKNELNTKLFDTDTTAMHSAWLYNYLGLPDTGGEEFMEIAREQADKHGVDRHQGEEVTAVKRVDGEFAVTTEQDEYTARYVVFATGRSQSLAEELGCELRDRGIKVDLDHRTTVDDAYAAGWAVRASKIQAIISAGGGAVAALDILSKERGKPYHDFDTPE